jgi:hypothetical protein
LRLDGSRLLWRGVEHDVPVTPALIQEIFQWLPDLAAMVWINATQFRSDQNGPVPGFDKAKPAPWYLLRGAAAWGGIRTWLIARSPPAQAGVVS